MLTDEELSTLSCKFDWETCPCLPCRARRDVLQLRKALETLKSCINIDGTRMLAQPSYMLGIINIALGPAHQESVSQEG